MVTTALAGFTTRLPVAWPEYKPVASAATA